MKSKFLSLMESAFVRAFLSVSLDLILNIWKFVNRKLIEDNMQEVTCCCSMPKIFVNVKLLSGIIEFRCSTSKSGLFYSFVTPFYVNLCSYFIYQIRQFESDFEYLLVLLVENESQITNRKSHTIVTNRQTSQIGKQGQSFQIIDSIVSTSGD